MQLTGRSLGAIYPNKIHVHIHRLVTQGGRWHGVSVGLIVFGRVAVDRNMPSGCGSCIGRGCQISFRPGSLPAVRRGRGWAEGHIQGSDPTGN